MSEPRVNEQLDPRKRRVAVLVNPLAGTGPSGEVVAELLAALRRLQLEPLVCVHRTELTELVERAAATLRCVVAAGGDGTLAEVLNRAPNLPVALLPLGNENLVANYFRQERSGRQLARTIATGEIHYYDLARANGRIFALLASSGIDADLVHRVHRQRRGHINRLTWVSPLLHALAFYRYPMIQVEIPETGERMRGKEVMVFNLPRYAGHFPIVPDAKPDDGLLDLCVFERGGWRHLARYVYGMLRRRHGRIPDLYRRKVRSVRLWTDAAAAPLQVDGDPGSKLPVLIEVVPRGLPLVVPAPAS
jgi:diacylglycerol kinase family enzyme